MKQNQEYKNAALGALKGRWPQALLCTIVMMFILYVCMTPSVVANLAFTGDIALRFVNPVQLSRLGLPLYILVIFPLSIGILNVFNRLYLYGESDCLSNFSKETFRGYGRNVLTGLLMYVFTILWTLLFIIPGIIKMFSYAMTPYIIKDYPELSPNKAIDLSCAMMKGRKFDLFYLYLSFIGWWLLSVLTCGIGFFWLAPYLMTAQASFYEDVKQDYLNKTQTTI